MSYEDYTKREWKVIASDDPEAKCTPGDVVTFGGPADKVAVKCKRYGDGEYKESDTIEAKGYEIRMTVGPDARRQITFTPKGSIGGSWTAEDNTPGPAPSDS
jgi:hypothetical protein